MACNLCIEKKKKRKKSKRKRPRCDMCTKRSCECDFRKKKRKRRSKPIGKTNPMEFYNPVGRFMQVGQPSDGFYASMRVNSQETARARVGLPQGNMPGPVLTDMMTQTAVAATRDIMTNTNPKIKRRMTLTANDTPTVNRPQQPLSAEPISTQTDPRTMTSTGVSTMPDTRPFGEIFPEAATRIASLSYAEGMNRATSDARDSRNAYNRERYRIRQERERASVRTMEVDSSSGGGDDMQQTGFFGEPSDLNILPSAAPDSGVSENV